MVALAEVFVKVRPDTSGLATEMKTEVEAAAVRANSKVKVKIATDATELKEVEKGVSSSVAKGADDGFKLGLGKWSNAKQWTALIGGGLTVAAPILGAALVGGMGLTSIGLGIAASIQNPAVKAATSGLGNQLKLQMVGATVPFQDAILKSIPIIRGAFAAISPDLSSIFSKLAPTLKQLATGFSGFLQSAMPGITAATGVAANVLRIVAAQLPALGASIGGFFQMLQNSSASIKSGIVFTMHLLEAAIGVVTDALGAMLTIFGPILGGLGHSATAIRAVVDSLGLAFAAWKTYSLVTSAQTAIQTKLATSFGIEIGLTGQLAGAKARLAAQEQLTNLAKLEESALAKQLALDLAIESGATEVATVAADELTVAMGELAAAEAVEGVALGFASGGLSLILPLLVAGAAAVGLIAASHKVDAAATQENTTSTNDFTQALIESNGALDANVKKLALKKLLDSGIIDLSSKFKGPSASELEKAYLGGPDTFQKLLNTQQQRNVELQAQKKAADEAFANSGYLANEGEFGKQQQAQLLTNKQIADSAAENSQKFIDAGNLINKELRDGISYQQAYADGMKLVGGATAGSLTPTQQVTLAVQDLVNKYDAGTISSAKFTAGVKAAGVAAGASTAEIQQGVEAAQKLDLTYRQSVQSFKDQQKANADAVTSTARSLADAQDAVGAAERTLAKDHQAERQAQLDLTQARKDAAQQLVDLKKQVRDSADTTEAAKIRLIESNLAEQQTRGLPSDSLIREKALLDQREAQYAYNDALDAGKKSALDLNDAQKKGVEGNQGVIDAHQKVKDSHQQTLDDTKNLAKARQAAADATTAYTDALKTNSPTLDINTKAGQNNSSAIEAMNDAWTAAHDGVPMTLEDFDKVYGPNGMGFNINQVDTLGRSIGLLPKDTTVTVTTVAAIDWTQLTGLSPGQYSQVKNAFDQMPTAANQRAHQGKAAGGRIDGPGTETSDSIPLWGSKGEWVHNAKAVKFYGEDFMRDLNAMKIPKLATGGAISDHSAAIEEILGVAKASGIPFDTPTHGQLTGGKHVTNSLHYRGMAVDFGGGTRKGMSGNVNKLSQYFMDHYGSSILEEIHTKSGPPYQGWYIKNGKVHSPYGPPENHFNHLHLGAAAGFSKKANKPVNVGASAPTVTPSPTTSINPTDLANGINVLKLLGISVAQDQAIGGIFKLFGIPFKTTTNFSKPGSSVIPTKPSKLPTGGKIVGASMYGGPGDPSSGTHGYHGDSLIGKNAYAELSTVPRGKNSDFAALGHLPYKQKAHISYNGKTVDAEKLDVGGGGGPISGHHRDVDLWYQTAQKLGFKGTGLVNFKTYDQGGWLKDSLAKNSTGKPEAVLSPDESAGLKAAVKGNGEVRLDSYSIQRLAQAMAMMKFDLIIDGKTVAVAMTPHFNKQFTSAGLG